MHLLFIAIILILALIAIRISNKSGIPALLLFLTLGILFNFFGVNFKDYHLADKIANLSLMIIMFYGGFGTNWSMARPVAGPAITLASLGVVFTSIITGYFSYKFLGFDFYQAMLLGSVVGSTDYASVSNILVSKNLNLKYNTASLLEIESGSNDPTAYTLTIVFISIILKEKISIPLLIFKQIFFGIGLGFLMGYIFMKIIKTLKLSEDGLFSVFIAAVMLGTYSLCDFIGGNGYLALYILGIYIGNKEFTHKKEVVFFYDGVTNLVQIALFFLLGLLSDPTKIFHSIFYGFILMIFMLLIARPISVFLLLKVFKTKFKQNLLISIAGIRGAAAIAFAIMAVNSGANLGIDLFHIVFVICLFSSLIQGSLMPYLTRKLSMFDPNDTVLNTFNYYQIKSPFGFIISRIKKGSSWVDKRIKEINPHFDLIIAKIERDGKTIIPKGHTIIKEGDTLVIGGEMFFDESGKELEEIKLSNGHPWVNKYIKDLHINKTTLIVMIVRNNKEIIIPNGQTQLNENDRIVILKK